ncbi:unnamed protein product [Soboliphyme baturini]|uniref:CA domain-containing protein n=1 Tax=Soboliphyme baturini TaxID=241478 RepID=A0A183J8P0_9BILA|nr:unnamed protein product [Soboliphyme baturini]
MGQNGMIIYSLPTVHPDSQFFMIDELTGQIRNKIELTGLETVTYEFSVRATDKPVSSPPLSSEAPVVVNVVRDLNRFTVVISEASVVSSESVTIIKNAIKRLMLFIRSSCKIVILEYVRRNDGSSEDTSAG